MERGRSPREEGLRTGPTLAAGRRGLLQLSVWVHRPGEWFPVPCLSVVAVKRRGYASAAVACLSCSQGSPSSELGRAGGVVHAAIKALELHPPAHGSS